MISSSSPLPGTWCLWNVSPVHTHTHTHRNISTPWIPGPSGTGTADQLTVKTLQSKGVYVLKAQAFPVCDVHWLLHMELKGMFTLMEKNDEKNLEMHLKKTKTTTKWPNTHRLCVQALAESVADQFMII